MRFADLAAAGAALADHVTDHLAAGADWPSPVVVAVLPNGVPVAIPVARALGAPLIGARVDRVGEPEVQLEGDVRGATAVVVDDGVETGTAARLAARAARAAGARRIVLAVPVCPREASATLQSVYDEIRAVVQPMGRRDLRWHFDDFDTIDDATARSLLARAQQP
jgi:putative phosphoribosyl transferase